MDTETNAAVAIILCAIRTALSPNERSNLPPIGKITISADGRFKAAIVRVTTDTIRLDKIVLARLHLFDNVREGWKVNGDYLQSAKEVINEVKMPDGTNYFQIEEGNLYFDVKFSEGAKALIGRTDTEVAELTNVEQEPRIVKQQGPKGHVGESSKEGVEKEKN